MNKREAVGLERERLESGNDRERKSGHVSCLILLKV